ncbi:MAG: NAAT family transporter [Pirellulales bacterium]|nr:NAAT family transporter [Pirellulales bacterium]
MEGISLGLTLFLVMDPLGNVPVFLGCLRGVDDRRRLRVVVRESVFALVILLLFLFFGTTLTGILQIHTEALQISGGVLLFLISVGMIFPRSKHSNAAEQPLEEEPFIVPLATPLVAGPSCMAILMVLVSQHPERTWFFAVILLMAWAPTALILMLAAPLSRLLGPRGLAACERLMGMILTVIAVQMLLDGVKSFLTVK